MGFGLSLKAGFLIYLICCSHFLDTLGRRKSLICGLLLQILTLSSLELLPNTAPLISVYTLQALFSVSYHLVYYAGWLYFLELTPPCRQSLAIVIANCGKSFSMIFGALMFKFTLNETYVMTCDIEFCFVLLVGMLLLPKWFQESPKYDYLLGSYHEARDSLKLLAKLNKLPYNTCIFREEALKLKK